MSSLLPQQIRATDSGSRRAPRAGRKAPSGLIVGVLAGFALAALETIFRYLPALSATDLTLEPPAPLSAALLYALVAGTAGLLRWWCGLGALALVCLAAPGLDGPGILLVAVAALAGWLGAQRAEWSLATAGLALGVGVILSWPSSQTSLPRDFGARTSRPDILLVVLDTVPARSTSLHGYELDTTPNLEKLAAGGAWFRSAVAPAPWTVPSHASLFTGALPREVNCHHESPVLPENVPTLAERLGATGYRTGAFVANPWVGRFNGLTRGFSHQEALWEISNSHRSFAILRLLGRFWQAETDKGAPELMRRALSWWDRADGEPSFVFLNLMEAHSPFHQVPGAAHYGVENPHAVGERTKLAQMAGPEPIGYPRPGEAEAARRLQAAGIRYLDDLIGELLETLRAQGRLEHTVIAVTSDHGEAFGEHGFHGHMVGLYEETLHVPLVLHYPPAIAAGTVVGDPVPLRMLHQTLLTLAGLPGFEATLFTPAASNDGFAISEQMRPLQVLADHIRGGAPDSSQLDRRALRVRRGDLVLLRETPTSGGEPRWLFFDLAADPGETRNLWPDPRAVPLRVHLESHDQIPLATGKWPSPPEDLREQLHALGYLASP